jgi:uncharacterized protein (DUF1778 family)
MESKSKMGTVALNIDKILASISSATTEDRLKMRSNAESWLVLENKMQRQAAEQLINALDAHEQDEYNALISELQGLDTAQRVIRAFTALPMSETEAMLIQALLDNPASTTTELSQLVGWKEQSWHLHFGVMCRNRASYLWPAPNAEHRDGKFYSGILADLKVPENLFTMKPDVAVAFEQLGLRRKS